MARVGLTARTRNIEAVKTALYTASLSIIDVDPSRLNDYAESIIQEMGTTNVLPTLTDLQKLLIGVDNNLANKENEEADLIRSDPMVGSGIEDGQNLLEAQNLSTVLQNKSGVTMEILPSTDNRQLLNYQKVPDVVGGLSAGDPHSQVK